VYVARNALASHLPCPQHSTLLDFSDSELIASTTWGARRPGLILGSNGFIWFFEASKARQWIVWLGWLLKSLLLSCHLTHSRVLLCLMQYKGEHRLLLLSYHCMCGQVLCPIQVSMVSSSLMSFHEWRSTVSHRSEHGDFSSPVLHITSWPSL
jgi:hypothetical protein